MFSLLSEAVHEITFVLAGNRFIIVALLYDHTEPIILLDGTYEGVSCDLGPLSFRRIHFFDFSH